MPTYSYACTECGNRFDAVQAFSDDALTTCPKCSGQAAQAFRLGGSGVQGQRVLPHRQPRIGQERIQRLRPQGFGERLVEHVVGLSSSSSVVIERFVDQQLQRRPCRGRVELAPEVIHRTAKTPFSPGRCAPTVTPWPNPQPAALASADVCATRLDPHGGRTPCRRGRAGGAGGHRCPEVGSARRVHRDRRGQPRPLPGVALTAADVQLERRSHRHPARRRPA